MRLFRFAVLALGLASFLAAPYVSGADDEKPKRRGRGDFQGRFGDYRPSILPRGAEERLKLSDEQKDKLAKLQKEYDEKQKDKFGKIRADMKKAFEDRDRDAIRKAMDKMRDVREDATKLRDEYRAKAEALLTDAQKKDLAGLGQRGRPGAGEAPGRGRDRGNFGRRPEGAPGLSPRTLEELRLTNEQKEKIAKLRKELEGKIKEVLTDDQKKKLEDLQKERSGDRRGPPRRSRRPADI